MVPWLGLALPSEPAAATPSADQQALARRLAARADSLAEGGLCDAAVPLYEQVLGIERGRLGADHPDLAETFQSLASCAYGQRDFERALQWQSRAVDVLDRANPPREEQLAAALRARGLVHYAREHPAAAAEDWQRALPLLLRAQPPDHREIVWLQSDLAEMKRVLGQAATAESLQVDAIARARAHLPADSFLATLLNNLGALYWDEGRLDETERLYLEALRTSESDSTSQATRIATAHLNLGVLYRDQARLREADAQMQSAFHVARAAFPHDDPQFVIFLLEGGRLRAEQQRWPERSPCGTRDWTCWDTSTPSRTCTARCCWSSWAVGTRTPGTRPPVNRPSHMHAS